jgi:hypothetical protein
MRQRLPLILSATALLVALLGATPLGQAAGNAIAKAVPIANFARNAGKLNGHTSSVAPGPGQIPVVDAEGKLAPSLGAGLDPAKLELVASPLAIVTNTDDVEVTAECPEGTTVISGGFWGNSGDVEPYRAELLLDTSPNGYRVTFHNPSGDQGAQVFALCASP